MVELDYMTTKTAATVWNISQRRVLALCGEGRIDGLARVENIWLIPKSAQKPKDARSTRYTKELNEPTFPELRPFIKWAGGKGQLLETIRLNYPTGLGTTITKYVEPFVGGGAVLFDILSRYALNEVFMCDNNAELINAYQCVIDHADELIPRLLKMQEEYLPKEDTERRTYYHVCRTRYNTIMGNAEYRIERATLLIFLNRTCFNGLYRVNRHGQFNVPIGSYKRPTICDAENLEKVSNALKNVTIVCGDYHQAKDFVDKHTFVYFDPPYRPLSETSVFTSYTEGGFSDLDQQQLAAFATELSKKGAKVMLSNSDPKNVNEDDNFFDDLYSQFRIQRVEAARFINSNKDKRGKINELLITNF